MHYRIYVSGDSEAFTQTLGMQTLGDFTGQEVWFAIEWITPISITDSSGLPSSLLLECPSIKQHNTYQSWDSNSGGVIAMLNGDGAGTYGSTNDVPYVQSTCMCGITRGDDLNVKSQLSFRLLDIDGSQYVPDTIGSFTFSMVFWTYDPIRPLANYDFFHVWLYSADRTMGTTQDCIIPCNLTTFSMYHSQHWNAGISYVSDTGYGKKLALVSTTFVTAYANRPVLGYFGGERKSVKPLNQDTLGIPVLPQSIDNINGIRFTWLNPETWDTPAAAGTIGEYTLCLTLYRVI